MTESSTTHSQVAVLGGGCFWCTEAVFQLIRGVEKVEPGCAGGTVPNPTYEQVSTGTTGHAEVARSPSTPKKLATAVLEIFFGTHDPTQLNGQGADIGTQYRSIILYLDETQRLTAQQLIEELTRDRVYNKPIVTEVVPLKEFLSCRNLP